MADRPPVTLGEPVTVRTVLGFGLVLAGSGLVTRPFLESRPVRSDADRVVGV